MQFSWDFLLNMLENDDSNLQTKFKVYIITSPTPNFEAAYIPPGELVGSNFFR